MGGYRTTDKKRKTKQTSILFVCSPHSFSFHYFYYLFCKPPKSNYIFHSKFFFLFQKDTFGWEDYRNCLFLKRLEHIDFSAQMSCHFAFNLTCTLDIVYVYLFRQMHHRRHLNEHRLGGHTRMRARAHTHICRETFSLEAIFPFWCLRISSIFFCMLQFIVNFLMKYWSYSYAWTVHAGIIWYQKLQAWNVIVKKEDYKK